MNGEASKWKQEAQKHAAGAGELRIKIAEHLEEIEVHIDDLKELAARETDDMSFTLIQWKIRQMEKERNWLKSILHTGQKSMWKNHIENRFGKIT